jgi:hypothetical protein
MSYTIIEVEGDDMSEDSRPKKKKVALNRLKELFEENKDREGYFVALVKTLPLQPVVAIYTKDGLIVDKEAIRIFYNQFY